VVKAVAFVRSLRFWAFIHTWTSLFATLFLLMLCITGLPLIFHDEIDAWLEPDIQAPPLPAAVPAAPLDDIVARIRLRNPGQYVLFCGWNDEQPNTVSIALSKTPVPRPGEFRRLIVDSRTADVIGETGQDTSVMDIVLTLHKDMFAGLPGELFLGFVGLVFVVSIVSGIVLYGRFMRKLDFGTIRDRQSARIRWLDLHNLIGIATVVWAIVVSLTGTMNTLAVPLFDYWRAQVLPPLLAAHQGKPAFEGGSPGAALQAVRQAMPHVIVTSLTFPTTGRFGTPRHFVVWTKGDSPLTARLFTPLLVDAETGSLTRAPDLPWYLRLLQISRPLHFGDYGGLPLKIIWAAFDLAIIVVLVSGLYLWFARRSKRRRSLMIAHSATLERAPAE
jgi:uncharacterized iron-regulated membrane protein